MRNLTAAVRAALKSPYARPVRLYEIDHPDGMVRAWSHTGTLAYNGYSWAGVGKVVSVTGVESQSDLVVSEIQVALANVPFGDISAVSSNVRGRIGRVWLAFLDSNLQIVPDPVLLAEFRMDTQALNTTEAGECALVVTASTGLWALENASERAWTHEAQQLLYPSTSAPAIVEYVSNGAFATNITGWTPGGYSGGVAWSATSGNGGMAIGSDGVTPAYATQTMALPAGTFDLSFDYYRNGGISPLLLQFALGLTSGGSDILGGTRTLVSTATYAREGPFAQSFTLNSPATVYLRFTVNDTFLASVDDVSIKNRAFSGGDEGFRYVSLMVNRDISWTPT